MIQLSQIEIVTLALSVIGVLGFIFTINAKVQSDRENRARDREQRIRDLGFEHHARGDPADYVRDKQNRVNALRTSRSIPLHASLSDPDRVRRARRWISNKFRPRTGLP